MSWSASAVGKVPKVADEIERQFANGGKCGDPEEGVRQAARLLISQSLQAQASGTALKVAASGYQSTDYSTGAIRNYVNIVVEPLVGFIE